MFDAHHFLLFCPALLLAITPGPGIFYVFGPKSRRRPRPEGILSSLGTLLADSSMPGRCARISAILAASAVAFHTVKYAGAAYLVWLGIG